MIGYEITKPTKAKPGNEPEHAKNTVQGSNLKRKWVTCLHYGSWFLTLEQTIHPPFGRKDRKVEMEPTNGCKWH